MATYHDTEFAAWAAQAFDWIQDPELVWLPLDAPISVFDAQRSIDEERVAGLSEHFIPAVAAGVVIALPPDGLRICVDGQHRLRAALLAGKGGLWALQYHWSEEQAAAAFRLKNGRAVLISTHLDQTRAAREAEYKPATGLYGVLDRFGLTLGMDRNTKVNQVMASKVVELIYAVDEGGLLDETLRVIQAAFSDEGDIPREAVAGDILTGIALFLSHFAKDLTPVDVHNFSGRLRRLGIDEVLARAREPWREHHTAPFYVYLEQQLIKLYNFDRQDHRRIPERTVRELRRELRSLHALASDGKAVRQSIQQMMQAAS